MAANPFGGALPTFKKEMIHIRRDPTTLFFALIVPIVQLLLIGFAINTNVRQIPTAILDESRTQESRAFIERLVGTDDFKIVTYAESDDRLRELIVAGKVKVGVRIPAEFSRYWLEGRTASVGIYVDGSDSTVTGEAVNAASGVAFTQSVRRLLAETRRESIPLEVRPTVLFNPDLRSANFFVPGMIAIVVQAMIILLTAFAIVRERENGTLEQLSLTPVRPLGLMIGKMSPYGILGFIEICGILFIMRYAFQVPIAGSLLALLLFSIPYLVTILGLGLVISTRAKSQAEAIQLAFGTLLPTIFLSGYIFAIDNMPVFFQYISLFIPARYFIEILRAIILRGAGFADLWQQGLILLFMGVTTIALAAVQFRKRIQ